MPVNFSVAEQTPPTQFVPVTITLNSKATLAAFLGALVAYGTAKVYAENGLKAIGLGDWYNGNVRQSAREFAQSIASGAESANVDLDGLEGLVSEYFASARYAQGRTSKAGSAVAGTDEDNSQGREESTHFEDEDNA